MTLAFGIDNAFALPLAATLASLLDGLSDGPRPAIYILSQDITEANKARLARVVGDRAHLHWPALDALPIDPQLLATSDNISLASYYRIFLLEMLPSAVDRVLYLDADVVVSGDLRVLWRQEMDDHVVMAVRDEGVFSFASPKCIRAFAQFGIVPEAPYFNAGVLLIDVAKWRAAGLTEAFLTYSKDYGHLSLLHDQDTLNVILQGRWGTLDACWNVQALVADSRIPLPKAEGQKRYVTALRESLDALTTDGFIIHYNYRRKPWHPWCRHPYRHLFRDYFRRSRCFRSSLGYPLWHMWRCLVWVYKRVATPGIRKRIWKRTGRTLSRLVGRRAHA